MSKRDGASDAHAALGRRQEYKKKRDPANGSRLIGREGNRIPLDQLLPVSFGNSVSAVVYSQPVKDVSELPL